MKQKVFQIRTGAFCFLLLAFFVLKPPSKASLETSSGTVISATQLLSRFDVEYSLANGQILKETFKSSHLISGDTNQTALLQLQGTNQKLNIWYKNGKVWQIQKEGGEFILKFEEIQRRRYIFIAILAGALFLFNFFLPQLIKK